MMNVGLHHRGVDTQLLAVLQFEVDRRLHHQIIDRLERCGRQPGEAAVECIVSRHRQTIEVRELAQCASIGNPLAQFAIVPVLDAHKNQRAQDLLRRQAAATSLGVLQAPFQIAADLFDYVLLVVKKIGNGLQQWLETQALTHQFPIGETDLSLCCPRHRSALFGLLRFGALSLQRFDVSRCRLVQQILQRAPVVQTALHLRNQFLRNIDRNATPFRAIVKHIALMLFARQTSCAVRANAPTAPQAQRAEKRRPQNRTFALQPAHDVRGRFRINTIHERHVSTDTRTRQENRSRKLRETRYFKGYHAFRDRNYLGVAPNILSARLKKLVDLGMMTRVPLPEHGGRYEYVLTKKGRDFFPTYLVLKKWGDNWLAEPAGPQVVFKDRTSGRQIEYPILLSARGKPLQLEDIEIVAGSGAVPFNQKRFGGQFPHVKVKPKGAGRVLRKSAAHKDK